MTGTFGVSDRDLISHPDIHASMPGRLLFVNACVRRDRSRTLRLAHALIDRYPGYEVDELVLEEMRLQPLDSGFLDRRDALTQAGDFDDPVFSIARRFADADVIVVATPYWENCFDSHLKIFMEHAAAVGVVFRYSPEGMPIGMCRARVLYYVTTRGGPVTDGDDLGLKIYESLCPIYGIGKCIPISASGLDLVGNDPDAMMDYAVGRIGRMEVV